MIAKCLHCGQETRNPKYCSRKCVALSITTFVPGNKINLGHHHSEETKRILSEKSKANNPKFWLGKKYSDAHRNKLSLSHGGSGIKHKVIYPGMFNKSLKFESKCFWENKCFLCGSTSKSLVIHHIDYNKMNSNDLANLIPLCRSCHSKTNVKRLRSFWKNYFEEETRIIFDLDDFENIIQSSSISRITPRCQMN
jgi:hypothetical protein